jgi:hypothetical protein
MNIQFGEKLYREVIREGNVEKQIVYQKASIKVLDDKEELAKMIQAQQDAKGIRDVCFKREVKPSGARYLIIEMRTV